MRLEIDEFVVLHRHERGEFSIEHREDPLNPGEERPLSLVVTFAKEALDAVRKDIDEYTGTRWESEVLPRARRDEEFLLAFLRTNGA